MGHLAGGRRRREPQTTTRPMPALIRPAQGPTSTTLTRPWGSCAHPGHPPALGVSPLTCAPPTTGKGSYDRGITRMTGVLRGLIQDPACDLLRITLPRTSGDKAKGSEEGSATPAPMRQHEIYFEDRSIRYSSLRGGFDRVGLFRSVVLVA